MAYVLVIFIFLRPFVSSLAAPCLNSLYSFLLLAFLGLLIALKGANREKIAIIRIPISLFGIALFASLIISPAKISGLSEGVNFLTYICLFIAVSSLPPDNRRRVMNCIIFSGFLISILAIYQYFFGFEHLLRHISRLEAQNSFILDCIIRKRAFSPFVTPNILAGYLSMIIMISLISRRHRYWVFPPACLALIFTQSLGAMISLFIAIMVYFYLKNKSKKARLGILLSLLVMIAAVFFTRIINQRQHFQPLFSLSMRFNYWAETIKIIKEFPLTGIGLGNFNLIQSRFAHNAYLQLWAETGILGLISFLWIVAAVIKNGWASNEERLPDRGKLYLATACLVFLLDNFFSFSFFLPEVALIWWLILGLFYSR
ncbi:MAG: hypothetical protein FJZ15_04880 [Candidatus Omnitrophica bacterium]|nr:hypothetical protein [Candidatus Omnitrophota bacterium]